jgi:CubicO group peptidase (beta-lactamase class C family)
MTAKLNLTRLAELHKTMSGHVERGDIPGLVALVACGDDVHADAVGSMTAQGNEPMRRDSIFRIASITKPVTTAAAMILIDDDKLALSDPVERWLPELANRKVLKTIGSQLDDTVPAKRSITVHDLLSYTFGFGSVMAMPGTYPIQKALRDSRLGGDGPPEIQLMPGPDEYMKRLGELPLMQQPGERWLYNTAGDVLGVLIARVSGKSFGNFLQERLFAPLGMKDTAFSVPASKLDRLPGCYSFNTEKQKFEVFDDVSTKSQWRSPPPFEWGSAGLVATIDDYFAFYRMLLNKGTWGGKRILSQASVEAMTRDQLTPEQRIGAEVFFGKHSSWGYGMSVDTHGEKPWNVPGRFGWDGGFGTSAYADPKNDFVGILFTQRLMDSPVPPSAYQDFWKFAYQALES